MMRIFCFLISMMMAVAANSQDKNYVFVFLNKKSDAAAISKEESEKIMKGHMDNINRLAKEGKLISAGPFEGGGGIFVLKTTAVDEARAWLSTDPGVQAQRWNVEVLPFEIRTGALCVAQEPYEMVTYHFVRYGAHVSKFTAQDYPDIFRQHDAYLKQIKDTGNVLIEGIFGAHEGGILIMHGDLQKEVIERDPGVEQGLLTLDFKKLWIAKGSFCEP
ncbi:MAG TPA: YciI family protein [Ohtaekwangia sp.]|nr:YciI family protein [Ohtaekwangia sp.]